MYERDYLMQLILQFVEAIRRSWELEKDKDPAAAADSLEAAIGAATDIDGSVLLSLAPESIAAVLEVSGVDVRVAEYIGRSMFLESAMLAQAGNHPLAKVRVEQARALAEAYGFELDESLGPQAAMEAFLASQEEA